MQNRKGPADAHERNLRRGLLPEVLLAEDIALILGIGVNAARRSIKRGDCGAWSRLGKRLVIRREALLQALQGREKTPTDRKVIGGIRPAIESADATGISGVNATDGELAR